MVIVDLGIDGNELAGLDLIERLRAGSKAAVLVFSMHRDPIIVSRSLNAGANGYLVKDSGNEAGGGGQGGGERPALSRP